MKAIAHRGCPDDYPENTVKAFREVAPKADIVECDVQRCGSGELVVFHDDTLDRVTAGSGRVEETDWSELKRLDVHDSGEPIPRLSEVLEAVPADTTVTTEIKTPGIVPDLLRHLGRVENECIVSSFHWEELRAADEVETPTPALAVLSHEDPTGALDFATELGCEYIHPPKEVCLDTDLIERAHTRGVRVNVWTAETTEEVAELRAVGADGVSTDSVAILEYVSQSREE